MTEAERNEIRKTMEALLAETRPEREADPKNYWFPDIFKERLPDMHDRFVADLDLANSASLTATIRCAEQAEALMRAAPIEARAESRA